MSVAAKAWDLALESGCRGPVQASKMLQAAAKTARMPTREACCRFMFVRSNDIEFSGERKRVRCNELFAGRASSRLQNAQLHAACE